MSSAWHQRLVVLLLAVSFGTAATFVSATLHPRFELRAQTIAQQVAIYERTPLVWDGVGAEVPSWRNRIVVPYAMVAVRSITGLSMGEAFLAVRWMAAAAGFLAFGWAAWALSGSLVRTLAAMGLLLHVIVLSFNHGWEHPTDYPDVAVIALGAVAVARRNVWWAAALAVLGAANRESSAFVGVAWIMVRLAERRRPWRAVAEGGAIAGAAYAAALALRVWNGLPGGSIGNDTQLFRFGNELAAAARAPFLSWPMLLAAALVPLVIFARASDGPVTTGLWRAAWIVAVATAAIAQIDELRIWLPTFVLLLCAGVGGTPRPAWR